VQRKLTAILSADVVGYSRLMEIDEADTMRRLKALRQRHVDPAISANNGRIFKLMGDGVLAEYASVVDAVQSAIAIQSAMATAEPTVAESRRIIFRIGINLGDVMVDGEDMYGDGINVAARIQTLASPGGVAVSGTVREHIGSKLAVVFEDFGEHSVKNIEKPIRVYMTNLGRPATGPAPAKANPAKSAKPSIAVLPFANMSGDPEQEYFSDGITEDIITDLSKVSALAVIARNTAFTFKGKAVRIEQVAKELGVQHVLEGSVRKAGGRVRITAQLIDGATNHHVWAERYDRTLDDIFALQDEISKSIVDALKVRLLPAELKTITMRSTDNPQAYQILLMARSFFHQTDNMHSVKTAKQLFAKALTIDPNYARAYAGLADCDCRLLLNDDPSASYEVVLANSNRALELDPGLADAYASRGLALYTIGHHADAEVEFERALAIDPNSFEGCYFYARNCFARGQHEKAIGLYLRAAALKPDDYATWGQLQMSYVTLGRLEEAREAGRESLKRIEKLVTAHPDNAVALCFGAVHFAENGETDRAFDWASRAELFAGNNPHIHYNLGCCFASLGQIEKAIDCLEVQLTASPIYVAGKVAWIKNDSDLVPLHGHPRYEALVTKLEAIAASAKP
jgi:adenylate cyclase